MFPDIFFFFSLFYDVKCLAWSLPRGEACVRGDVLPSPQFISHQQGHPRWALPNFQKADGTAQLHQHKNQGVWTSQTPPTGKRYFLPTVPFSKNHFLFTVTTSISVNPSIQPQMSAPERTSPPPPACVTSSSVTAGGTGYIVTLASSIRCMR